jgi:Zn-dependent protease
VGSDGKVAVDANGDYLLKDRGYLGVRWATSRVPVGVDVALRASGEMTAQTMGFIVQFPVAVYDSVSSLFADKPRAGDGAISIVGIGQIAGEANANQNATLADRVYLNLMLLGSLNLALFAFNMIPLPPLDGGHIAGGIYEYLKRGAYRLVRKPDPGPVDTALMAPVSGIMFILLLLAGVAMMVVDIVNPVGL